jgi:hypothetical protein
MGKTEQGHEGLSFANAMRESLLCGVLCIDGRRQAVSLTGEAAALLGLPASTEPLPLEVLPAPLLEWVRAAGAPAQAPPHELTQPGRAR